MPDKAARDEYLNVQSYRCNIAYHILQHEMLMALKVSTLHSPINIVELQHLIIVGLAKAAGELA